MSRLSCKRMLWGMLILLLVLVLSVIGISEYVRTAGLALDARSPGFIDQPVAIVLGAAVWPGKIPSHMLEDRVRTAVRLWQEGRVSRLFMSGNKEEGYDEPAVMRTLAISLGVPATNIIEDPRGWTTRHTMYNAVLQFGIRDGIVITQSYHLPRAIYLANQAGLRVAGQSADLRIYSDQSKNTLRECFARIKAWLQEL